MGDYGGHVVVAVLGQAASEDYVGFLGGKLAVLLGEAVVAVVVHGVVWLLAGVVLGGVFAGDDGARVVVDGLAERLEMLVFDDAGELCQMVGIVHHCVALPVWRFLYLCFKRHGAPVEATEAEVEVFINCAGVYKLVGHVTPCRLDVLEVDARLHIATLQQSVDEAVVASDRYALIVVVEVVIVECQAHRQAADDECRKLGAGAAPLLLGVVLYKQFVDVAPDEAQRLLLEVAWVGDALGGHTLKGFAALFVEPGLSLGWSAHAPQLIERVHVEGQVVDPAVGSGSHRAVGVAIEWHNGVNEIPHRLVGRVEDVRPILVYIYALNFLAIHIAAGMRTAVDDQASASGLRGKVRKRGAKQPGPDN